VKTFRNLRNFIKKKVTLKYPISVRVLPIAADRYGDCYFDSKLKKFVIRIDKSISEDTAINTLIHEVAHCICYFEKEKEEHGKIFGNAYSKAYEIYEEWLDT